MSGGVRQQAEEGVFFLCGKTLKRSSLIENEMDMVLHQALSKVHYFAFQPGFLFAEIIKVIQIISITGKHHLQVMTSLYELYDMMWTIS